MVAVRPTFCGAQIGRSDLCKITATAVIFPKADGLLSSIDSNVVGRSWKPAYKPDLGIRSSSQRQILLLSNSKYSSILEQRAAKIAMNGSVFRHPLQATSIDHHSNKVSHSGQQTTGSVSFRQWTTGDPKSATIGGEKIGDSAAPSSSSKLAASIPKSGFIDQ
ncbi:hypothetical protein ACLOJK_001058 [Asimina triloba]